MSNVLIDPQEKHFRYLDSARGIAAMMVCVMHFFERKYKGQAINDYLSILFNGRDAVSFFFVLSGFVLSYKYLVLNKPLDLRKFFTARFFRLWPAYFTVLVVCCLAKFMNNHTMSWQKLGDIFIFNKEAFWEEAFLVRFHNKFFEAGWTLTFEMVASFLMPFYIIIARKDKKLITWLILIFIFIVGQNFFSTIHFLLGILISCNFNFITHADFKQSKWFKYRYGFIAIAIAVWPWRYYINIFHFGPTYKYLEDFFMFDAFHFTAFSSAVFLVLIIYNKLLQRLLETKLAVYVGTLSYSLYLVHPLAISLVYDHIEKRVPANNPNTVVAAMIIAYLVLLFAGAWLLHQLIEAPAMAWGKKVIAKFKPGITV